ncbi:MAG: sodium:solute symporter [Opitutaceae bacterium]
MRLFAREAAGLLLFALVATGPAPAATTFLVPEPGPAVVTGSVVARDGRGHILLLAVAGDSWSATLPGMPDRHFRGDPGEQALRPAGLADGFAFPVVRDGEWIAHRRRGGGGARVRVPAPAAGLREPVGGAGEGGFHVAARSGAGLRLWALRSGADGWRELPAPPLDPAGRTLALLSRRDALHLFAVVGDEVRLHRWVGGKWEPPVPVPPGVGEALLPFSLGPAQLGLAGAGDAGAIWAWHGVTRAWARLPLPPGMAAAGLAAEPDGRGALLAATPTPAGPRWGLLTVAPRQPAFGAANYAALAAYLVGIMGVGIYFMRRARDARSYFLGGGRIPWWAAGISVYATTLSSITVMTMPAKSFATDWTFLLAPATILLLAPVVIRFYLPFFRRLQVASAYEYLERRFHPGLRAYASLVFVCFQLGRVAIVTYLPSLALATVCGFDLVACILVIGGLCTLYTVLGGIEGSIWTSVLQAGVMCGAAVCCLAFLFGGAGGSPAALASEALADGKLRLVDFSWGVAHASTWIIVLGNLLNNLVPYTSDQSVIQRYLTTTDEAQARRAIWLNGLISFPSAMLYFAIGTGLYLFFKHHPAALHPSVIGDSILPFFIAEHLPAGVAGLVVAGIFAAAQSNVSSDLNSGATALVTDFVERGRPGLSAAARLRWARGVTAGLGVATTGLALLMTTREVGSFLDTYIALVGLMGTGLAALFALGIFTVRANAAGAAAGVLVSAAALLVVRQATPLHFFGYGIVGFGSCFLTALAVSAATGGCRSRLDGLTLWTMRPATPPAP